MASLEEFYKDGAMRDNVRNYLIEHLTGRALEKIFNREDVSGMAEAKETIEEAFNNLDALFGPKPPKRSVDPR